MSAFSEANDESREPDASLIDDDELPDSFYCPITGDIMVRMLSFQSFFYVRFSSILTFDALKRSPDRPSHRPRWLYSRAIRL